MKKEKDFGDFLQSWLKMTQQNEERKDGNMFGFLLNTLMNDKSNQRPPAVGMDKAILGDMLKTLMEVMGEQKQNENKKDTQGNHAQQGTTIHSHTENVKATDKAKVVLSLTPADLTFDMVSHLEKLLEAVKKEEQESESAGSKIKRKMAGIIKECLELEGYRKNNEHLSYKEVKTLIGYGDYYTKQGWEEWCNNSAIKILVLPILDGILNTYISRYNLQDEYTEVERDNLMREVVQGIYAK